MGLVYVVDWLSKYVFLPVKITIISVMFFHELTITAHYSTDAVITFCKDVVVDIAV